MLKLLLVGDWQADLRQAGRSDKCRNAADAPERVGTQKNDGESQPEINVDKIGP